MTAGLPRDAQLAGALHEFAASPSRSTTGGARGAEAAEDKLLRYLELLAKWNRVYNLTAITQPQQMLTHHLLDSLAIVPALESVLAARSTQEILDVGSGAGLPGIPLAIVRPEWSMTLIDSNGKKTAFIQQAAAELVLPNIRVLTGRVEQCSGTQFDVIVCRAFSSLRDLVLRTRALRAPGGKWAAMKGVVPHDELRELPADIRCSEIIPLRVPGLDAERHLLLLEVNEA
jgi:16S rRNA (guanine527-N7)-methyltransferase